METGNDESLVWGGADGMISVFLQLGAQQRRAPENRHGRGQRLGVLSLPPTAETAARSRRYPARAEERFCALADTNRK